MYNHQHRNLPLDTCVVDRATVAKLSTQQPAWFAIRCSGKIVVLRIKGDEQIEAGDAVVNPWVVETFNMSKGTAVNVEMVEVSTLGQRTEVELSFVAHYSLKHWDEVAYGGALSLPHIWTPVWQRTGKVALVENHCKLALFGSALCDGALIVIQTLDSLLVSPM